MIESEALNELLARWKEGVDKPFKGSLIDYNKYNATQSLSCMCAQGQILHVVGGYKPVQIMMMRQYHANKNVADILQIPIAHARLLYIVNDNEEGAPYDVLLHPEKYLGPNADIIMAGWDIERDYNNPTYDIQIYYDILEEKTDKGKLYSRILDTIISTPFHWDVKPALCCRELTTEEKAQALDAISRYKEQYA